MKQIITFIAVFSFFIFYGQGGPGSVVLPGNFTCDNEYINVMGCDGDTTITYNGYTYGLVEIGGQCWLKENLRTTKYSDSTPINFPDTVHIQWEYDTSGAYGWYDNDSSAYSQYGAYYNWHAVDNSAGLCPTGWHVPTDCEWMYMEGAIGMSITDQEIKGYRGTDEGGKLKDTTLWSLPNTGATNSSGFTALPGGQCYYDGGFDLINKFGYWWTSSTEFLVYPLYRSIDYNFSTITRYSYYKNYGYSVRCIKDDTSSVVTMLEKGFKNKKLTPYPNPFSTSTTIELPSEPLTLSLYDVLGNKVREEKVFGTSTIERGNLKKGVYIIVVRSRSTTYKAKLFLE